MKTYTIQLNALQAEILLDTVQAFVGNQKLLHLPDQEGEIVGLPLTEEALQSILSYMEENQLADKQEIKVEVGDAMDLGTPVTIQMGNFSFQYHVNMDEFDSL